MLQKTRGIVLRTTQYSESSVVAKIFTEKFGLQTYLINGVKKPKAKIPMNMLQALHLLDLVVYHKAGTQMQRISEARLAPVFRTIPYELIKNTIVQFLNEVLYKCLGESIADEALFQFIFHALCWFDETETADVNFHLAFLIRMSRYLGFAPHFQCRADQRYFDLQEGAFTSILPLHPYFMEKDDALFWEQLYSFPFEQLNAIKIPNAQRKLLLSNLLTYYTLHTASFGQVKSHHILEDVLA